MPMHIFYTVNSKYKYNTVSLPFGYKILRFIFPLFYNNYCKHNYTCCSTATYIVNHIAAFFMNHRKICFVRNFSSHITSMLFRICLNPA